MRTFAARMLLAGVTGLVLASANPATADTRTVPGQQLVLTDTLSGDVVISTTLAGSGGVRLSMDGPLSCLSVAGGPSAIIGTSACTSSDGPLRIEVSPDTPVTIISSGDGDIKIGDLRAPLVATSSGSGNLVAGHVGGLALDLRSDGDAAAGEVAGPVAIKIGDSGDVRVGQVHGALSVKAAGSGDLVVGGIDADTTTLDSSGSGDMLLGGGRIGTLTARLTGSGDLDVAAPIHDADVTASGGGDVRLAPVSGVLNRSATDGSTIVVGGPDLVRRLTGRVADKIGNGTAAHGRAGSGTGYVVGHVLAAAFVALVLYISWRIMRRGRGPGGARGWRGSGAPAAPTNPAVIAVGETMTRLDQRLARLEGYVTNREFDLARKFRDLERQ